MIVEFARKININGPTMEQERALEYLGNTVDPLILKSRCVGATRTVLTYMLWRASMGFNSIFVVHHASTREYVKGMTKIMDYDRSIEENVNIVTYGQLPECLRASCDVATVVFDEYNPNIQAHSMALANAQPYFAPTRQIIYVVNVYNSQHIPNYQNSFMMKQRI